MSAIPLTRSEGLNQSGLSRASVWSASGSEAEHHIGDEASDSASASMVHGDLGTFSIDKEPIVSYLDRFGFYCVANGVTGEEQRKAVFLSIIGHETYDKLRDLLHPVSVQAASLSEITEKLRTFLTAACGDCREVQIFQVCATTRPECYRLHGTTQEQGERL